MFFLINLEKWKVCVEIMMNCFYVGVNGVGIIYILLM